MISKNIKVIFDTNVWIGFLIGKRLSTIQSYISNGSITIVITDKLLKEIIEVTKRQKFIKYFNSDIVEELIEMLNSIAVNVEISPKNFDSRDLKDNFLLDLIEYSKADYLVTGDQDLLLLNPFQSAKILSPKDFEIEING